MTYGGPPFEDSSRPPPNLHSTRSHNVKDVLNHCLQYDPHQRGSHSWLAHHPYTSNPTAL
jgi:serine/threonine protein kinase